MKMVSLVLAILLISGFGWFASQEFKEFNELKQHVRETTLINGVDYSLVDYQELEDEIVEDINQLWEKKITLLIDSKRHSISMKELGLTTKENLSEFVQSIQGDQWQNQFIKDFMDSDQVNQYDYQLNFYLDETLLRDWLEKVAKEHNQSFKEASIKKEGDSFLVVDGSDEWTLDVDKVVTRLGIHTSELTLDDPNGITIEVKMDKTKSRHFKPEALKTINQKVSTFSSVYPTSDVNRSKNLELGTSKINGAVLMPNDEFSFTELVAPVTTAMGYRPATIFINGKTSTDIGGGICQVSSTLYNVQLRAGILPTERKNHSLRVGYVPIGQDATMYEGSIDYKFKNTLDYPIYIEAVALNGTLTISFWSNEKALNGMTYEPKTYIYNNGLSADTTLYGYDATGKLVYQKFLHTSRYKG